MFYFHLFLSVFRKVYFRFFVSLNPLIKIFLLPSPSLPPSFLPPFLPLSLPSCLFFFFLFKPLVFPFFKKAAAHNASEATFVCFLLPPWAADARPTAAAPGAGVCAAAASLGTSHFFPELWHHVRLVLEVPFGSEKGALVLQRPPLSGTGNPLPGPPARALPVSLPGGRGRGLGGAGVRWPHSDPGPAQRGCRTVYASPKTSFLSLSHAFIHSFVHSPLTDIY